MLTGHVLRRYSKTFVLVPCGQTRRQTSRNAGTNLNQAFRKHVVRPSSDQTLQGNKAIVSNSSVADEVFDTDPLDNSLPGNDKIQRRAFSQHVGATDLLETLCDYSQSSRK